MLLKSTTRSAISLSWCKASKLYLAFSFVMGFAGGCALAGSYAPTYLPLMRRIAIAPASIVCLVLVWLLPFLITAFAVYKLPAWSVLPIAFCKAFSYGFVLWLIYMAFPGAGWLVWFLLLFTDSCSVCALYAFMLRNVPKRSSGIRKDLLVCGCVMAVVTVLDLCLLSPFLVMLINN